MPNHASKRVCRRSTTSSCTIGATSLAPGISSGNEPRTLQGYLAYKKNATRNDPSVGPCLGSYGGPRGGVVILWARYPCTDAVKTIALLILHFEMMLRELGASNGVAATLRGSLQRRPGLPGILYETRIQFNPVWQ